jgi:hypothetical protein
MSRTVARSFARNEAVFRELKGFGADVALPDTPDGADRAREIIGNARSRWPSTASAARPA